jgi:hypothetical protein
MTHMDDDTIYNRQHIADMLRRMGLTEQANEAMRELPEEFSLGELQKWSERHGITRDDLISRMGGSP